MAESGLQYDRAAARALVAIYATPDVVATRHRVLHALELRPGERLLDVGSGPGFLAAEAADAVGPTGRVCGVDISDALLAYAREHDRDCPWLEYRHADAGSLPFGDGSFDAVVSMQVLEYVPDVDAALAEIARVLRAGGRALIVDTDWDSMVWHMADGPRGERVLGAWAKHCPHPHLPRTLAARLRRAGLAVDAQWPMVLFNPTFDPETYSNRAIDLIARYASESGGVPADEARDWATELRDRGKQGDYFFSLNRYVFQARKA